MVGKVQFSVKQAAADTKAPSIADEAQAPGSDKKTPMPWVHWFNGPEGGVIEDWEVDGFPTIYVLDHKGVIRYKDVRDDQMKDAVEALLEEVPAKKGR